MNETTPKTNNKDNRGSTRFDNRGRGPRRGGRPVRERVKPEFDQKMISLRRVARVVAGGRRFNFSATLVIGDRKGRIGVGVDKASDTTLAVNKAYNRAKKALVKLNLTKSNSIAHEVRAKYGSSEIFLKPSPSRGLVAGSSVRTVLELAGVHDVIGKIHTRSKNKLNIARATIKALKKLG